METTTELNLFRALSPLHVGSGNAIGVVDLPIQRESHTNFPKVESSSLKGAIRAAIYQKEENKDKFIKVFGNNPDDTELIQTGAISVSEARILLFPVQSLKGVFTYVTSSFGLKRFLQEQKAYYQNIAVIDFQVPEVKDNVLVSTKSLLTQDQVVFEEYTFKAEVSDTVSDIAEQLDDLLNMDGFLMDRFAIIPDDEFSQFVQLSTDITTRIRIDSETGVVAEGALFYEENVPAETVFYSTFHYRDTRPSASEKKITLSLDADQVKQFVNSLLPDVIQIGGNQTIGRGMVRRTSVSKGERE